MVLKNKKAVTTKGNHHTSNMIISLNGYSCKEGELRKLSLKIFEEYIRKCESNKITPSLKGAAVYKRFGVII